MKVISIGSDRNIFKESPVRDRVLKQSEFFEELHMIVFSSIFKHRGLQKFQLGNKVWVYPTRSWSRVFYIRDAIKLGKKIIGNTSVNTILTTQDPFESGQVGLKLKELYKIPLQIQVHTDFLSPYFAHTFLNKIRVKIAEKIIPQADKIRVVSKRIKDSLVKRFKLLPEKISVLPVYVDIEKIVNSPIKTDLHKKYPQFNFIILMASRLTLEKNIPLAIKSFCTVLKVFPKAGLIIVGSGHKAKDLKSLTRNLNIEKSVIFEEWQNDLASYYKTANLYLLTSFYEGFSMTLVEAAAAGCPIVTSDIGIAGDILLDEEHIAVCTVQTESCFTEKIIDIISNNHRREIMKQNARAKVLETLNWNKDQYMKEYVELLG